MTLTEVVALVGRTQRDAGAGAILYEFDCADGIVCKMWFVVNEGGQLAVSTVQLL